MNGGSSEQPLDELIAGLAVDVPDFPVPGVLFRDLTPVFADPDGFRRMVEGLTVPQDGDPRAAAVAGTGGPGFDVVVGVEARGFLLAAAVALVEQLGAVVTAISVVIELAALGGRQRVAPHAVHALWTT